MRRARVFVAAIAALAAGTAVTAQMARVDQDAMNLSRAVSLFATDDPGPEAMALLNGVASRKSVNTRDGATARYYIGRLHHRNYYMLKQADGLTRAADAYRALHKQFPTGDRATVWYAEARLYKAIAYLEMGDWKDAYEAVDHINPKLDGEMQVDYLVWSVRTRRLDRRVPTAAARDQILAAFRGNGVTPNRRNGKDAKTVDAVLAALHQIFSGKGASTK